MAVARMAPHDAVKDPALLARIPDMKTDDLIPMFEVLWTDTAGSFCEEFSLDKKQFKKWLKKKGAYTAADVAVRSFVTQVVTVKREGRRAPLQSASRSGSLAKNEFLLSDMESRIEDLSSRPNVSTAILIDGDACSNEVRKLEWMLPKDVGSAGFHVLAVAGSRMVMPPWWSATGDSCSWIRLEEALPNEADYAISVAASLWVQQRRSWLKEQWSTEKSLQRVYLVARDKFAEPLSVVLKKTYGVACAGIDPTTVSLSLVYLFELDLRQLPLLSPTAAAVKAVLSTHYTNSWTLADRTLSEKLTRAFGNDERLCAMHVTDASVRFLDELFVQSRMAAQRKTPRQPSPAEADSTGASPQSVSSHQSPEKANPPSVSASAAPVSVAIVTPSSPSAATPTRILSPRAADVVPATQSTATPVTPVTALPASSALPVTTATPPGSPAPAPTTPMQRSVSLPSTPLPSTSLSPAAPVFVPSAAAPAFVPQFHAGKASQTDFHAHPWLLALQAMLRRRVSIPLAEIGQLYPSENLATLGYTKWAHLLELPAVQDMLNADFIPAGTGTPAAMLRARAASGVGAKAATGRSTEEIVNNLDGEELRRLWKLMWRGLQGEFCAKYECNRGNFSSWLNKRRLTSPASSAAVRQWLIDIGYKGET